MEKDLAFIAGDYLDDYMEIPRDKEFLKPYFKTKFQKQFLRYHLLFGTHKQFIQHTGHHISIRNLQILAKRIKIIEDAFEKANKEMDFEMIATIRKGKLKFRDR